MWVFSPDFNQVAKYADEWVGQRRPGRRLVDGGQSCAAHRVSSPEADPYFIDYTKKYTDAPFLVELVDDNGGKCGRDNCCAPIVFLLTAMKRTAIGSS